ncbi:MAG: NAD(P)-binding domain-containing protein [Acidobacteriaceae bacterium]|nr:NAD(P)-binding domain-containing protein [Acidobacteriaceae bacterium]
MKKESLGSSSSGALRIAVIGVGGIGSTFAFQLVRSGHEVTAVARPGSTRLEQLEGEGGVVDTKNQRAELVVKNKLDEETPYDLVLVTLPAYQAEAVLPELARSAAKWIQFMFNTFNPELLRDAVGARRCSFGMPFVQGSLDANGRLTAKIGAGGQKTKMNDVRWVQLFNAAGLPAVFEPDMLLWLRCHVPMCIAFESVSVAGQRRGGGASWSEALTITRGLQEGFTLIQRMGYRLHPSGKALLHAAPAWAPASMLWFMSRISSFRELLGTGVNECRALVDLLVSAAQEVNPAVSVSRIEAMKPTER